MSGEPVEDLIGCSFARSSALTCDADHEVFDRGNPRFHRARTYASWSHDLGVPTKVTAELLGHARVDVTLNTYTQVMPDALRDAVRSVSEKLFTIVHSPAETSALTH